MGENIEFSFFSLGTMNNIKLYGCNKLSVHDQIISRVQEIDDHMSSFKENSDISMIASNEDNLPVKINNDTSEVIERALWYYENTNGAFDITIKPLTELWGIGKKYSYIPTEAMIYSKRRKVNASRLHLSSDKLHLQLDIKDGAIDLGGIAKGYAADEVKRIILENGIENAIINLGGNIVTIGSKPDKSPWRIGVQNPLEPRGEYLGIINANNKTIVTSGTNEQFFIKDSIRYHHIIDPRTGYPAQTSLLSVTAVCDNSMDADALTTSLFVLGYDEGIKLLEKVGADAIFVTSGMDIKVTDGIKDNFTLRNIGDFNRGGMYVC
jgi:thiamine biosynthesis lipoprotein